MLTFYLVFPMYVIVKLLNGCPQDLTYSVPERWRDNDLQGALVTVPLMKRLEPARVTTVLTTLPPVSYHIKDIHAYDPVLNDPLYKKFIANLSAYYALDSAVLYRRLQAFFKQKETENILLPPTIDKPLSHTLTQEQQAVVDGIVPFIEQPSYQPCVIHGVTGSGKTEVYQSLMSAAHASGKAVIFLVPEVSLAVRFEQFFRGRFTVPIFGFHSATSAPEKKQLWQALRAQRPLAVIGVHLPTMLPIPHLGLIIIDEEHEIGYQEKKHPRINSKEAALLRAHLHGIPVVLGSATPSISTLYNVQKRGWKLFTIRTRFAGAFPQVSIVKLKQLSKERRHSFWISKQLEVAIAQRLSKKEQVIIFLNRRGHSFFMQCEGCGFIFRCVNCSVTLTFHQEEKLCCHYCGFNRAPPTICSACSSTKFLKKGIGTQQIVTVLQRLFGHARIGRADLDTTINKKKWQQTINSFYNRELDILVGTQTITKGYHFPQVTLVGILWADMHLSIPTYNAGEATLQQLIQVAGRAGRQHPESSVIVQTMLDHTLLEYVDEAKYLDFYEYELALRSQMHYPPVARFAEIELRHEDEQVVHQESLASAIFLRDMHHDKVRILGPAQPPVHKIKNIYVRKIYLKGNAMRDLINLYKQLEALALQSGVIFTPNPLSF